MLLETNVVSFVLRFVLDQPAVATSGPAAGWHAVIRHVQSGDEQQFTRWADAVAFIARHVNLDAGGER